MAFHVKDSRLRIVGQTRDTALGMDTGTENRTGTWIRYVTSVPVRTEYFVPKMTKFFLRST